MRAACTMSRWIDVDRPWGLTTEQSLSVNKDSQIQAMIQSRAKLKQRLERRAKGKAVDHPQYNDLSRQISNEKQRLRYALIKEVQQRYDQEQPVKEVERQLSGVKVERDSKMTTFFSDETPPEQKHLIKTVMLAPPGMLT